MKKNRKKLIIILIIPILMIINIKNVEAFSGSGSVSIPSFTTGNDGNNNKDDYPGTGSNPISLGVDSAGNSYSCEYKYDVSVNAGTFWEIYNQENKILWNITKEDNIKAGTAIGINIYETKVISWKVVETKVTKTSKTTYTCRKKNGCRNNDLIASIKNKLFLPTGCNPSYTYLFNQNRCPTGWEYYGTSPGTKTPVTSGSYFTECENLAKSAAKKAANSATGSSYKVKYRDSNDINKTEQMIVNGSGGCVSGGNTITCRYSYNIGKSCVNQLTSQVRYVSNDSCNTNEDEIEVKNDSNHSHYFIPLNAKSTDRIIISLSHAGGDSLYNQGQCNYIIKHYPNTYQELIIPSEAGMKHAQSKGKKTYFVGGDNPNDYDLAAYGCYVEAVLEIPITQKFYNEETIKGKTTFNGFNFYYRPIDISNPFPNGVDNESYWYEWSKSNKKKTDLTKSFTDGITYQAVNIDASKVREYNTQDGNDYPNWTNSMYPNGTSKYINTSNIIKRENPGKVYALGCGPANQDWKECDDNS